MTPGSPTTPHTTATSSPEREEAPPAVPPTSAPDLLTRCAPQWLADTLTLVDPVLRAAIDTLHPDTARMARYHKGWVDADGNPATGVSPGKGVRPALALWSARAAGASPEVAIPAAVAVELVHDFSLVHDDIIDEDRLRRGRPTAWTVYGIGPAVLLGDLLLALAHTTVTAAGPHGADAARALGTAVAELCRGQAADLEFESRESVSVQEYVAMVEGKTGALIRFATTAGAVLAGTDAATIAELDRLGSHLGAMFQIVDDLLGVHGDPRVTGKPVGSDLARRKKSLPILAALASDNVHSRALRDLLTRTQALRPDELTAAAALVEQAGGRRRAEAERDWHHRQAFTVLDRLRLDPVPDTMLRELVDHLATRTA